MLHPFTGPCAYTQGNRCGSLRIKDGSTVGAGGPATDTSETTSHELNPPLPHRTYCALILRKLTLCGTTSAVTTEARLHLHTCHQHYQVCCVHFLGAGRHLDCGPPGKASLVDHIWKRPLSKLHLPKHVPTCTRFPVVQKLTLSITCQMRGPSPLKYKIMVQTFCRAPVVGELGTNLDYMPLFNFPAPQL